MACSKQWKAENPERSRAHSRKCYANWSPEKKAEQREKAKQRRRALRLKIIEGYGGACKCCGERRIEFLAVDHKNSDGAKHRREMNGDYYAFYQLILRENFPDRFRLLCHNCNCARGFYGYCPHEKE